MFFFPNEYTVDTARGTVLGPSRIHHVPVTIGRIAIHPRGSFHRLGPLHQQEGRPSKTVLFPKGVASTVSVVSSLDAVDQQANPSTSEIVVQPSLPSGTVIHLPHLPIQVGPSASNPSQSPPHSIGSLGIEAVEKDADLVYTYVNQQTETKPPTEVEIVKAAFQIISRHAPAECLVEEQGHQKVDLSFPVHGLETSSSVTKPMPKLLADVFSCCSELVKGDNPQLPKDTLIHPTAVLPTLREATSDATPFSLHQLTFTMVLGLSTTVPATVSVNGKHFALLQQSVANFTSTAACIQSLSLAITEVVTAPTFTDELADDLQSLHAALAVASRDLAVVAASKKVNLRLLDRDTSHSF